MSATAEAWLDDVIAHPGDDAPRLIFADWLEEHGDEARAEFIRVQCALARHEAADARWGDSFPAPPVPEGFLLFSRREALRRREWELLAENVSTVPEAVWPRYCRWCEEDGINTAWVYVPGFGIPADVPAGCHFRRGFVAQITCRLEDWCGGRCPAEGCVHGMITSERGEGFRCPACRGTGRAPGHGPALVRAAPLERVTLSDVWSNPRYWGWTEQERTWDTHYVLPRGLFRCLPPTKQGLPTTQGYRWYGDERDALDALSDACLSWANAEADRAAR